MTVTNQWWQKAVVYQVYPRSFQDSNGDGIGDLPGITSRLDYIKQLGADVIWLNPIYRSPGVDNGYDISDYYDINPEFGTMADFETLLANAHQRGLKIMMDIVVNHSSNQNKWFTESAKSKDNPYSDYYIWRDPVDGHAPNNWGGFFGGSVWEYVESRQQYYMHSFAVEQPDLNWENPKLRQAVYDMMNFWVDKGVDGFRLDVINLISKPTSFADGQPNNGEPFADVGDIIANGPRLSEYLQEMHQQVFAGHDLITVGETPSATVADAKQSAGLTTNELNMVFEFEHMGLDGNPAPELGKWNDQPVKLVDLKQSLTKWQTGLHGSAWNSLYWNNHDQPRIVSRFGNDTAKYREVSAKMLATLLHGLQGTPYVYEGEELGMTSAHFKQLSDYQDLESLNAYHHFVDDEQRVTADTMLTYLAKMSRDNARTPMQWNTSAQAGFTTGQPWLQVNPNYTTINAAQATADNASTFAYYQQLIKLRHTVPVITTGDYQLLDADDDAVYAYLRTDGPTKLLVIANFTDQTQTRHYDALADGAKRLIGNYEDDAADTLRPYEAKMYLMEK
ncbi:glycoside hydrolase family 13 protein [Lactiplantibacillus fabifermentans]|uniref:Oligo-1,6-glucosidase n=1 Tax=Lactiplantibacillus fabifermentans T30PCM01 TaxID=1400520 RepID=W6TAM2_9LACO|nr:alpha-glucosidase [Lactiplantibacillus fabifermentans]ETY75607.1 oligo-1,6-glucosidase [Lactiplantibacillus fabifermentans T30PCM01]